MDNTQDKDIHTQTENRNSNSSFKFPPRWESNPGPLARRSGMVTIAPHGPMNVGDHLLSEMWKNKDRVALINAANDEKLTLGQIAQEAMNLAVSLVQAGVRKGEVVAVCSEKRKEFWSTVIGVACTGATVTTISTDYGHDELKHIMGIAKPKYIFCSPQIYKAYSKILRSLDYLNQIILYGEEKNAKTILYNDLAKASNQTEDGRMRNNVQFDDFQPVDVSGDDTLFVLYSSGTTALPKGIMLTQLNILTALAPNPIIPTEVKPLTVTPWFHIMGLISTMINFIRGVTMVYLPKFDVDLYYKSIEKYRITDLKAVPSVLVALCKSQPQYDVSSVELVYSGAAALSRENIDNVMKRFPNARMLIQGYGLTETAAAFIKCVNPDKLGSVGAVTSNNVVKVVNKVTREVLGPNQHGEICVKSVMLMKGYIGKDRSEDFDDEGFFKTGDIGYYDEDKYFYIVDRLKEFINYKEFQVAPAEIEAVLLKHEGVRDAGVIGISYSGEDKVPLAFVVTQPGVTVTEKEIQDYITAKLPNHKHLRGGVVFIDEMPKTPSGKIMKRELRKIADTRKKNPLE